MAHSSKPAAAGLLLHARRAGAIDQLQLERRRCQRNRFIIVCMNADVAAQRISVGYVPVFVLSVTCSL